MAQAAEHLSPYRVHHLLDCMQRYCKALHDDLVDYMVQELGDEDGVLVWSTTPAVSRKAGVRLACNGTIAAPPAGSKIARSASSSPMPAPTDRHECSANSLFHTHGPMSEKDRRRAKEPETIAVATKPQLAPRMIERAGRTAAVCLNYR